MIIRNDADPDIPVKTLTSTKSVEKLTSLQQTLENDQTQTELQKAKKENLSDSGVLTTEQAENLDEIEQEFESKERKEENLPPIKEQGSGSKKTSGALTSLINAFLPKSSSKKAGQPRAEEKQSTKKTALSEKDSHQKSNEIPKLTSTVKKSKPKSNEPLPENIFDTISIHLHGGGFMAMSTSYHECYLRVWANKVKCPIFSIDYRLAPLAKYPENIHDCIRGYL